MKYIATNKKIPKAVLGVLLSTGIGMASNAIANNKAKKQQEEDREAQLKLMTAQKLNSDNQTLQNFDTQGSQISSLYMNKGGKLATPTFGTIGGELKPLASDTEEAVGNKHNENTIDNTNGIKLMNGAQPVAEIEDEEIIKDGEKVYSDKLKPKGSNKTYAELVKVLTKKKGKYEDQLDGLVHRNKSATLNRNIEKLDMEEEELFNKQEMDKERKGIKQEYVSPNMAKGGKIPKGQNGLGANFFNKISLNPGDSPNDAIEEGYEYGGGKFGQNVAPYIDNAANFINTLTKPKVPKPTFIPTQSFNTKVNVTDKISNVNNAVEASSDFIKRSSSNSNAARGNMIGARLQGANQINSLLANKENQERDLQNRASQEQSRTAFANANIASRYNDQNLERSLDISRELSANVANAVDDYGKGVQYRDAIQLDKEKNALYEKIYAGNNQGLIDRGRLDNATRMNEWKNNPELFKKEYDRIMSDPNSAPSTKRQYQEINQRLFGGAKSSYVKPSI